MLRFFILFIIIQFVFASSKPVTIRDKSIGQLVTSSLLVWENFMENDAKQQLSHAVIGGEFTGIEKYPAYICRSTVNSVPISGYVMKPPNKPHVCIVSQHMSIKTKQEFEILLNKANGTKVLWVHWEKLIPYVGINGLISTINGGSSRAETYFIARHKKDKDMEHHEIDHAIGWFDPDGLGKIHVTIASTEKSYEKGELLVAIEPVHYELHEVEFVASKLREKKERRILGHQILKNEGNEEMDVDAAIGYEYDTVINLGNHEGIARSLNTTVYYTKKNAYDFLWGIQKSDHTVDSKTVNTKLAPGTALNVTLWGTFSEKEGPYNALLVTYYGDGTKSKKRRVSVHAGYESRLEHIDTEFSATYWLHNDTVVPTSTQRTVKTSSSTHQSVFSTSTLKNSIERITEKLPSGHKLDESNEIDDENEHSGSLKLNTTTIFTISTVIMSLLSILNHV